MKDNSVISPTVEDIRLKIKERIKEAPDNWMDKLSAKEEKSALTLKSYIYNGRGKRKHLASMLKSLNEIIAEFNSELEKELSK